ncbi:MAG TPA: phage portal protein [Solirubrobacteraceae bacterium]|nr:phage portal protein [Solirubrobacteraceae bacterium]
MRSLFSRIFASPEARAAAGVPSYGLIPPLGSVPSASGLLVSQATAMTVSAVYRAVYVRAHDVARCKPSVFSEDEAGVRTHVTDHPIAKLMRRPNRVQTWFEFMRDLMVAYLLRGNAYAAILRDRRGDPVELILINPDAVLVLEAADGSWFYNVNRLGLFQIAMLRDLPVAIPSEDVLHLRGISFNMLIAASTIGLARDSIGLSMGLSQQQSRWVGNGARPSGIIKSPKVLTDAAAKRLKAQWQEFSAGIQNVGRTAVLEEGMEWQPLQLTAVDLQFVNQLGVSVADVGRFLGVPLRKLMLPDTSRGSTIIQEDQSYINETVAPDLEMIEQKFVQTFDLDAEGLGVDLDESPLLRADPLTRYNLGRIGKLSGLISTNEWRRGERLPPDPNGNEIMQPLNLAALGSDVTGTAPDGAGHPEAGTVPDEGVPTKPPRKPNGSAATEEDTAPEG